MSHPVRRIIATFGSELAEPTDAELLARFAADRDAGAFELLVWRHAGLVLRTCRGVLGDHHAAEDAAQAVFLALARQAPAIGSAGSAAGWLFRVARRVANRSTRRHVLPTVPVADLDALPAPPPILAPDFTLDRVLHEELDRLSEPHRTLVLLCFFEGLTHAEAARRLGWPVGTVASRVARAKDKLAALLTRRGVSLSAIVPTALAVSSSFTAATTRAAVAFATKKHPLVSAPVLELAKREIRMTLVKKAFRFGTGATVLCVCLAFGLRSSAEPPVPSPPPRPVPGAKEPDKKPPQAVVSKTFAVAPITTELQRRLYRGAGPNSAAVVIVDGSALFKDPKTLNTDALNLKELRTALAPLRPEKGRSVAHIDVHYGLGDDTSRNGADWIGSALNGALVSAGFTPGDPADLSTTHNKTFSFEDYIAPLKDNKGADETENSIGDERVRAYPVRTPLSRVRTQSAAFLDVYPRLDCKTDDWVPENVDKSVRAAIEKLKLAKDQRITFSLNIHPERDLQTQGRVRRACTRWAENAGLELWQISY
ncbi:RNA polymerase sigma factor [Gemmata sp. G18]|uniref:RNA polymerase sigma factor n=1 Tax=Gemmata palustris TaxID=2822762 RepID=A0ABS5BMY0_9BACT|nr:RNA polymerase sigma factor [Gemmata palustris]MBP3955074.1 RNA polymerase sigma factor [Gemmata palustris]